MKKKLKQLITTLFAVTLIIAGLPAMETKAATSSVTLDTATSGQLEYTQAPITVKASSVVKDKGLEWQKYGKNFPFIITADAGFKITKIEAKIGSINPNNLPTSLGVDNGDVESFSWAVNNVITISNIDAVEVNILPQSSNNFCNIQLKQFVVYYTSVSRGSTSSKSEAPAEPPTPAEELRAAEEEALPLAIVEKDKNQVAKDDTGIVPDKAYNLSAYVTTKGFVSALNKIAKANSEENSVSIFTGKPFTFNKGIVEAINKGEKEVVYYFKHAGHLYSVTVPADVDAAKVLEENGHAGPLYVGQQLGTTKLVK